MNLGDFHKQLDTELKQGGRLDSIIPTSVARAVEALELIQSLQYMSKFVEFTVLNNVGEDRLITLPARFKSFANDGFLRLILANGKFKYILKRSPDNIVQIEEGDPDFFWLDGDDRIYLDKSLDRDTNFEMSYVAFSNWPTELSATHTLLSKFSGLLFSASVLQLSPVLRDAFIEQTHQKLFLSALQAAQLYDEELQYSLEFNEMQYGHTD